MARKDPSGNYNFIVEIDGLTVAHFFNVSGLNTEVEVVTHQEGGKNDALHKLPGPNQYGAITFKRGVTSNEQMLDWLVEARNAGSANASVRKDVSVILIDNASRPVRRFNLRRAWPSKWTLEDLGESSQLAVETLELVHEGINSEKHGLGPQGDSGGGGLMGRLQNAGAAAAAAVGASAVAQAVSDAQGAIGQVQSAAAQVQSRIDQIRSMPDQLMAEAQQAAMESPVGQAWQDANAMVNQAQAAAADPAAAAGAAMAEATTQVPQAPPMPPETAAGMNSAAGAVGAAPNAAGAANVPAGMEEQAALEARGFVRGGQNQAGAAEQKAWSDGVDAVQNPTGFPEAPLAPRTAFGPSF